MFNYDLRLEAAQSREKERFRMLARSVELGWDCVAWNTKMHGKVTASSANGLKPFSKIILDAGTDAKVTQTEGTCPKPGAGRPWVQGAQKGSQTVTSSIRQISRLSVALDEVIDAQTLTLGNEVLRNFEIVAATPGNAKVFSYLCSTAEVDLISLDFTHKLPFALNKKHIDAAVSRGISFEVVYAGMLGAQASVRKDVITGAKSLIQYLNGKTLCYLVELMRTYNSEGRKTSLI